METAEKRRANRRKQTFRKILFFIGVACIILSNAALQQSILKGLGVAANFVLMIVASIGQFWGLMYWLGSTKVEEILPGDAVRYTMADYVGQPTVTENIQATILNLRGQNIVRGSELPKGILLAGPPGGGKTHLARCLAGDAEVAVLLLDASGIVNMFMGMSQVRTRTLFGKAKRKAEKYGACLLPGQEILTERGLVPIEQVQQGDLVLSADGEWHRVAEATWRHVNEDVYRVKIKGRREELVLTGNHPVMAVQTESCTRARICKPTCSHPGRVPGNCAKLKYRDYTTRWQQIAQLRKGDALALRKPVRHSDSAPDWITPGLAYLIGRIVGDGWVCTEPKHNSIGYRIAIVFNAKDTTGIAKVTDILRAQGWSTWTRAQQGATVLYFSNAQFARWFLSTHGHGAYNKTVPVTMIHWPDTLVMPFLRGLHDADGHHNRTARSLHIVSTISPGITNGILALLYSRGIATRLEKRLAGRGGCISGRTIEPRHPLYIIKAHGASYRRLCRSLDIEPVPCQKQTWELTWQDDDFIYSPISSITTEQYQGPVYNLEVEGCHSYTAPSVTLHNCILVFDEIDAIASARGSVMGSAPVSMYGGMGTRGLNTLLTCIDGLGVPPGIAAWFKRKWYGWRKLPLPPAKGYVLFIGCTNRPDVLDPALTRPGRVDKSIWVHAPYEEGLREIIEYYLDKIDHTECDTALLARTMRGRTPATVRTVVLRQAALQATLDGRDHITQQDIYLGLVETVLGLADPPPAPNLRDRQLIAVHEAGHAIALMALFPKEMGIWLATIVPHSGAQGIGRTLGVVWPQLTDERQSLPLDHYVFRMQVSMAGRSAVELTGRTEMGATGDMRNLAGLVAALTREGGFGDLAAIMAIQATPTGQPAYPKGLQETVGRFLARQRKATRLLLERNWEAVEEFAALLLDKGTVTSEDVDTFFTKHELVIPDEVKHLAQLDKERYEKLS